MPKKSPTKHVGPLRSIRLYCLWCCNDSAPEVRACSVEDCALFTRRLGKGPKDGKSVLKVIRAKCLDCSGGNGANVRSCWDKECSLYRFRMGKNPALKGKGAIGNLKRGSNEPKEWD